MKTKNGKQLKNIRLDKHYYTIEYQPVFVTINADNKKNLFVGEKINNFLVSTLIESTKISNCSIPVYCLMPNHLHFIVYACTTKTSITDFVRKFKSYTARIMKKDFNIFPLWQKRYYDHIIRKDEDLMKIAEYIYENPARKRLVMIEEEYVWHKIESEDKIFSLS